MSEISDSTSDVGFVLFGLTRVIVQIDPAEYLDADALTALVRRELESLGLAVIDLHHPDAGAPDTVMLWIEHELMDAQPEVVLAVVQATVLEQVNPTRLLPDPIVATTWRSHWELLVTRPKDVRREVEASIRARFQEFVVAYRAANRTPVE